MTEKVQLPEGWKWTTLGEISNAQSGVGFPKQFQGLSSGDYPLVKVSDISESAKRNGGIIQSAKNYLAASIAKKIGAKVFPVGTTLFAKIGEAIRLNRRAINSLPILADNNVMGLIPKIDEVTPKYLFKYMHSVDLYKYSQATTVPSVRKSDIEQIQIPLPPLDEQERIVAKIESLFSQLDAGVAALQRIRAALKRYKASVLKAAFEGRLVPQDPNDEPAEALLRRLGKAPVEDENLPSLPEGWCWVKWEQLIRYSQNGFGKRSSNSGLPTIVLRLADTVGYSISFENVRRIRATEGEIDKYALQSNDLICIRVNGSLDNVGRMIVFRHHTEPVIYCDHFIRFRFIIPEMAPFLSLYFNDERARKYIEYNHVSSAGQNTISQATINNFSIPLPPLKEQQSIVSKVEQLQSIITEIEGNVTNALNHTYRLRQVILKQAFEGKLI